MDPASNTRRYRLSQWLDITTCKPLWVIETQAGPGCRWHRAMIDGKPLASSNRPTAVRWLRWLRNPAGTQAEWGAESDQPRGVGDPVPTCDPT